MCDISLDKWAEYVIERWLKKIIDLDIGHDSLLKHSFTAHVRRESNGDVSRIEFLYNYYGRFVDMGVGRGVPVEDAGMGNRKIKRWYTPVLNSQIKKLAELMGEDFVNRANSIIIQSLTDLKNAI